MMGQRFFDYGRELKVHFYENEKKNENSTGYPKNGLS